MDKYFNRHEAGKILAENLRIYKNRPEVMVLALPRGGVPVGYEIAKTLHAPLDVFVVRKLGVPGHSELAMGAIASGNVEVFNDDIILDLAISKEAIDGVLHQEKQELKRRELAYRGHDAPIMVKDKTIILVDDGIATGATMRAAICALDQQKPHAIIVAIPVADKRMCEKLESLVYQLICPLRPLQLYAVGAWYIDFSQTEDDEVHTLLKEARQWSDESTCKH